LAAWAPMRPKLRGRDPDLLLRILDLVVCHHQPAPKGFVLAGVAVDIHADVGLFVGALLRRRRQGHLQGAKHDVPRNILLAGQRINQQ
jgi:hypothetical protein